MTTTTKTEPSAKLADKIQRYVEDEGPAKGLVHAQMHNHLAAVALAESLAAEPITTPSDVDKLLESEKASECRAIWCKGVSGSFYDYIDYKAEKGHDEDGNEVTRQVPTPHKINVSARCDKYLTEITQAASLLLKQQLRTRPVAFPERHPDNAAFLGFAKMVLPNVENPAAAATALRVLIENLMANRDVEGARKQAVFILLLQRLNGGGGKGLWLDGLIDYCKSIGLLTTAFNPAEFHFVSDAPGYADLLTCHEAPRVPKEAYPTINNIVDNVEFESQRKHCPAKIVQSVSTLVMASNYEYSDQNNRRVMTIEFAANRILTLADDELKYFDVYKPVRTNKSGVRYQVTDNKRLMQAWEGLFRSVVFGAVYDMPTKNNTDQKVVQLDHRHLRALQIMQQVRDADLQDGTYNREYENALTCRPGTEYRDVDHCISTLVKCSIIDKSEKAVVRSLLCQLLLEASRMNLIPGHGRKADRIPFSCFDFEHCTVDDPDGNEEGYTFAAISNRWDRLIAAYADTTVPQDPNKGGKQNDGHGKDEGGHSGHPEKSQEDQVDERRAAAMHSGGTVGAADLSSDICQHGCTADPHDSADQAADDRRGLDATIDQLLDSYAGTGVASTTSPACTADDKPGTSVVCAQVSPTPSGRVVDASFKDVDTECKSGDFISGFPFRDLLIAKDKFEVDNLTIDEWKAKWTDAPQYLVTAVHQPGMHGRTWKDLIPTYMVFESDTLSKEEQKANVKPEFLKYFSWATDTGGKSIHWLLHLPPYAQKKLTNNKDLYHDVWDSVNTLCFKQPNVVDKQVKSIGRLTRCPFGIRADKPPYGVRQELFYCNPDAEDLDLTEIIEKLEAKYRAKQLRAAFFDNQILENEEEALEKLDNYYYKHLNANTLSDELDIAHEVVCHGNVDPASGVNWLGGLNCLRGYHMPRAVLETYLNRVREVHPTHLPQDNDYYLEDYGRKEVA